MHRLWKVFFDDKDRPNRYILGQEMISRPDSEDLEVSKVQYIELDSILWLWSFTKKHCFGFGCLQMIFGEGGDDSEKGQSFFSEAVGIFNSLNRFMKFISKWNNPTPCNYDFAVTSEYVYTSLSPSVFIEKQHSITECIFRNIFDCSTHV